MKKWTAPAFAMVVLAAATGVAADTTKTYTGCVAAGQMAGTFTLTGATEAPMAKDAMAKDNMAKDAMKNDAMKSDAMKSDAMSHDAMGHDMGKTLALESKTVDFSKQVGHKVSVTGSDVASTMGKPDAVAPADVMAKPLPAFAVTSLKTLATTCGK